MGAVVAPIYYSIRLALSFEKETEYNINQRKCD